MVKKLKNRNMHKIIDNIFLHDDICNVYIIKSGNLAVLIDFGTGGVLDRLPDIGVDKVAAVLLTHHHRDQCQNLKLAVEFNIPIWVPHTEQDLIKNIDEHWQGREIYNNYNVRQDRFSILDSVPIAGTLRDYKEYVFADYNFTVLPTPGHTTGAVSFLLSIDGYNLAFTGDLIASPGKIWSLAATQWTYNGGEGLAATAASLLSLKERHPNVLLPSHGVVMYDPEASIDLLNEKLFELMRCRMQNPRLKLLHERPFEVITPHLLRNRASMAYYYVLVSKSGKAMFFDFGYDFVTGLASGTDRTSRRPWLYTIQTLKRDFAVSKIDVVMPTHYHDDHVAGINLLRDVEGTQVWAAENFADILMNPAKYDLPCLWYDPILVDKVLEVDQSFCWEEYEIVLHKFSGHTSYEVAISFKVDGKVVLLTGDQYQGNDASQWNYVYKNRFNFEDYKLSAYLIRKINCDIVLTGHWEPYWVEAGYFDALEAKGEALERLHNDLLFFEEGEFPIDALFTQIHPYQVVTSANTQLQFELEIQNPLSVEVEAQLTLYVPNGWKAAQETLKTTLLPKSVHMLPFEVIVLEKVSVRRARISIDLSLNGIRLGQIAEALITVE